MKEAIKLVVIMHTHSSKLQAEIIAQYMSYEKLIEKVRAIELTKKEVEKIKQREDSFQVDILKRRAWNNRGKQSGGARTRVVTERGNTSDVRYPSGARLQQRDEGQKKACTRCGFVSDKAHECRALNAVCNKCQKRGHYAKMCQTTKYVSCVSAER